jgi:hypothetical protein
VNGDVTISVSIEAFVKENVNFINQKDLQSLALSFGIDTALRAYLMKHSFSHISSFIDN